MFHGGLQFICLLCFSLSLSMASEILYRHIFHRTGLQHFQTVVCACLRNSVIEMPGTGDTAQWEHCCCSRRMLPPLSPRTLTRAMLFSMLYAPRRNSSMSFERRRHAPAFNTRVRITTAGPHNQYSEERQHTARPERHRHSLSAQCSPLVVVVVVNRRVFGGRATIPLPKNHVIPNPAHSAFRLYSVFCVRVLSNTQSCAFSPCPVNLLSV